jgi:hypothetical protein
MIKYKFHFDAFQVLCFRLKTTLLNYKVYSSDSTSNDKGANYYLWYIYKNNLLDFLHFSREINCTDIMSKSNLHNIIFTKKLEGSEKNL